ncbi:hypothetical protein [Candidatus Bandiella numerosa]|uniref:hypothetical protein n=1 Tax=Candidatus Bandiella numerosa TaxID=2570586 RepID=UPI001F2EB4DB|nr:hypothetical protein [Candidatus Bandiella numerosa]
MNRIFFTVIYFLILQNFLLTGVIADSGFSSDFIEQAKKLGINVGQNLDQKVNDNDLSDTSNSQSMPEVQLPSPPKPEAKQEVKIDVKAGKVEDEKMLNNKKQEPKQKVSKKLSNTKDKNNATEVVQKPKALPAKIIPKQKVKKSITYFTAPEKDIDTNLNQKSFMRRKPYSYDVKPPQYLLDIQKKVQKLMCLNLCLKMSFQNCYLLQLMSKILEQLKDCCLKEEILMRKTRLMNTRH